MGGPATTQIDGKGLHPAAGRRPREVRVTSRTAGRHTVDRHASMGVQAMTLAAENTRSTAPTPRVTIGGLRHNVMEPRFDG